MKARISNRIIPMIVLFVLLTFVAGCSQAEVSEEQIQNDVISSAPDWDEDAVIDTFAIVRRTGSNDGRFLLH